MIVCSLPIKSQEYVSLITIRKGGSTSKSPDTRLQEGHWLNNRNQNHDIFQSLMGLSSINDLQPNLAAMDSRAHFTIFEAAHRVCHLQDALWQDRFLFILSHTANTYFSQPTIPDSFVAFPP